MLNRMFKRRHACVLGFDITDDSIKVVAVSQIKQKFYLEYQNQIDLPLRAVIAQEIKNPDLLAQALSQSIKDITCRYRYAVTALPFNAVIAKTISIEKSNLLEMEAEIILAASTALSYPANELALDYRIMNENKVDALVEIYYLAARKASVHALQNVFRQAGISLQIVDVDVHILVKTLLRYQSQVVALFCVDKTRILMVVVKEQQILFATSETLSQPEYSAAAQKNSLTTVPNQIKRCWHLYTTASNYQPIAQAFLIGDYADDLILQESIATLINLPISLLNNYSAFDIHIRDGASVSLDPAWFISIQLAMRGWQ